MARRQEGRGAVACDATREVPAESVPSERGLVGPGVSGFVAEGADAIRGELTKPLKKIAPLE